MLAEDLRTRDRAVAEMARRRCCCTASRRRTIV